MSWIHYRIKPLVKSFGADTSLIYQVEEDEEKLMMEVFHKSDAEKVKELLEQRRDMVEEIGKYELTCGCKIEPQYLPINGGERFLICEHGHEHVIAGIRKVVTEFRVRTREKKVEDEQE